MLRYVRNTSTAFDISLFLFCNKSNIVTCNCNSKIDVIIASVFNCSFGKSQNVQVTFLRLPTFRIRCK